MAKRAKRARTRRTTTRRTEPGVGRLCAVPVVPERQFDRDVDPGRARLIQQLDQKWVNGTVLHYYFFDRDTDGEYVHFADGTREWRTWVGGERQKQKVREAFRLWKNVGIGLEFEEAGAREDAEIRIGFMQGDGSWSYIGRYILNIGSNDRTMNIGWDISRDVDTAIHEIGHTLGFPHEHQNPNAGITWNEDAVYAALARPPNSWSREKTYHNIIRKIPPDTVQGSNWDPDSIMHYPFGPGLILAPPEHRNGISPAPGLSDRDETWVKTFYPELDPRQDETLTPNQSVSLSLSPGAQRDFVINPDTTRYYEIRTFGMSDTVIVLFEDENGTLAYRTGDDDSGFARNAYLRVKLVKDRRYVLRVRLYWSQRSGQTSVMLW